MLCRSQPLLDEARRLGGGLLDLLDVRLERAAHGQLAVQQVRVYVDRREQIVELMRHAARETSDRLQLLGQSELGPSRSASGRVRESVSGAPCGTNKRAVCG